MNQAPDPHRPWLDLITGPGPFWIRLLRWSQRNMDVPDVSEGTVATRADTVPSRPATAAQHSG